MEKLSQKIVKYFPWIVIVLGLVVYGLMLFNGFVWDDEEQVVNNLAIRSLSNIPYLFTQSTFNTGGGAAMGGMYYKPIMPLFFTLIYQFSGLNAWGYHLVQLAVHLINVYLIFLVLRKFIQPHLAALAALIFLVHPANVESVAYISGLQDVLFMLFGLLALLLVIHKKTFQEKDWLMIFGLLLLSLLSKETGVLFLLTLAIYLFFYKKQAVRAYLMYLSLLVCLYLLLRLGIASIGANAQPVYPIMLASFWERIMTIPKIMFNYLRLIFFPFSLAISQNWTVKQLSWSEFLLPLIVSAGFFLSLLGIIWRLNQRLFWFFGILLVIGLGMHSQLVTLDMTMSERWLYFPLFAILALIYSFINKYKVQSQLAIIISFIIIAIFSVRTCWRVWDWRDGLSLFQADYSRSQNFEFENNLGVYLHRAGKYQESLPHYERSVKLQPKWWTNWNNLGVSYQMNGQEKKAERAFLQSIKNGDYYLAYENYANLLLQQERYQELIKFLEKRALPRFPYNDRLFQIYQYAQEQNVD